MEEETVTLYEIEEMPGNRRRIGRSFEAPLDEALMLVDQHRAKFPDAPIGKTPDRFTQHTSVKALS